MRIHIKPSVEKRDSLRGDTYVTLGYRSRCMGPPCAAAILPIKNSFNHFAPSRPYPSAWSALRIKYIAK
jgi:hypothetical protein